MEPTEQRGAPPNPADTVESSDSRRALRTLSMVLFGAGAAALVFAGSAGRHGDFLAIATVSLLLLGASALTGGILGFLFGIPRTLQGDTRVPPQPGPSKTDTPPTEPTPKPTSSSSDYVANTNLEQISDWLTKILVGVGLTQLSEIRSAAASVVAYVVPALGAANFAGPFAYSLMLSGLILGFLFGYLWTRLFLIGALRQADRIGALRQEVDELKRQGQVDAKALNLIDAALSPRPSVTPPSHSEIEDAVRDASKSVKTQIHYRARDLRSRTWSDPNSKEAMALTIPVFRALIFADEGRKYHANHGQLAYALKDKKNPDYVEAASSFTTAIDIRDRAGEGGWSFYELFRAVCSINQDPGFLSSEPSADSVKGRIISDLRRAFRDPEAWRIGSLDPDVVEWSTLNSIALDSLRAP